MDDAARFTVRLSIGLIVALAIVMLVSYPRYQHPSPSGECSPYDYPICERSVEPAALAAPNDSIALISAVLVALAAIAIVYASHQASVFEQKDLVTSASEIAERREGERKEGEKKESKEMKTSPPLGGVPMIVTSSPLAPSAKPEKGVDTKEMKKRADA